ncbi:MULTISPECIES: hypothetical protein [Legionella]|uniref:hypothetical protein n=1 Tax=Legionella TaxID=445 RepID=UPI000966D89A|nr:MULTISPECIES: hypothetical protein [Legionella]MBN9228444.1 hypothetical protein [Legionella steelei]OJW09005.1 MAG: hypothetical protein BGO44_15500 [Legionella sp. 39-23]
MRTKLTSGLSMFAPRSSLLSMEPFFKLDSNMWGFASHRKTTFARGPYMPISFGGTQLTRDNALPKLSTLTRSQCYARTMDTSEFAHSARLGSSTQVPSGLCGASQLVKYQRDGSVDARRTESAFTAHHKQTGKEYQGAALSFSHQWSIYHVCSIVSGKSSIVLVDPTGLPDDHMHVQGTGTEEGGGYDPSGDRDTYSFEHEVTLQDVPAILIPGRLHRQATKVVYSTNPFFIDLQNKSLPEEVRSLALKAVQDYAIANAIRRTGKPVPGRPVVTIDEAIQSQVQAIDRNFEAMIEILGMGPQVQNMYYTMLCDLRGRDRVAPSHYTHIEVEEPEQAPTESSVKIEEITDEEAIKLEGEEVQDDVTAPKSKSP